MVCFVLVSILLYPLKVSNNNVRLMLIKLKIPKTFQKGVATICFDIVVKGFVVL